jgi:hypothetical protein
VNVYWVKIRSWHGVNTISRGDGTFTKCGRYTMNPRQDERVISEKTCENCLRLVAPR